MSWTNPKLEKQAEKLFAKGILPLAAGPGGNGPGGPGSAFGDILRLRPDPAAESYFIDRDLRRMEPSDFEIPACSAEGNLADALWTQWAREPRLAGLANEVARLAEGLRKEGQQQSDEVSPFIYVMF